MAENTNKTSSMTEGERPSAIKDVSQTIDDLYKDLLKIAREYKLSNNTHLLVSAEEKSQELIRNLQNRLDLLQQEENSLKEQLHRFIEKRVDISEIQEKEAQIEQNKISISRTNSIIDDVKKLMKDIRKPQK